MPTPDDIQAAVSRYVADSLIFHGIVHGNNTHTEATENGTVPSIAKAISDLAAAIVVGYAAGFVARAANAGVRATTVPNQIHQLLIQDDTLAIYYSTSTAMGAWTFHPVQNAANDAATALAAVATLTTALAGKMNIADYVGGGTSDVHTALQVRVVATLLTGHPHSGPHFYGAENGVGVVQPILTPRCTGLINGEDARTGVDNTSNAIYNIGGMGAFFNNPRHFLTWGAQSQTGILASGISGPQSFLPRHQQAYRQYDRDYPTHYDLSLLISSAGQIDKVVMGRAFTMAHTADGRILVSGSAGQGVKAVFGSNVDKDQPWLMSIYFNNAGVNALIRDFDAQDALSTVTKQSCAIFVDVNDGVWILSTNVQTAGYGATLSGPVNTPVKISASIVAWTGFVVKKVKCDCTGGVYVLFTNGELWGGGGSNASGIMNTGGTGNVLNPVQLITGIDDFCVMGHDTGATLTLFALGSDGVLHGIGYNGDGRLGQGDTALKKNWVSIATNVDLVRCGGSTFGMLFFRTVAGSVFGCGRGTDGNFANNANTVAQTTAVALAEWQALIDAEGFVDFVISSAAGKISACLVTAEGNAYVAGKNIDGALGFGQTGDTNTWFNLMWSKFDEDELIVDCCACIGPNGGPAFAWRTDRGRILQAGAADKGFATGVTPVATYNQLTANPVQINRF